MAGEIIEKNDGYGLNDRQKRLVDAISSVSGRDDPQLVVGYGSEAEMLEAARSPLVQAELKARRSTRIRATLATRALRAMEELITNDKTPAATKFSAAKWVLEQAGHTESQAEAGDKPLAEMTEQELLEFMNKAQAVVDRGGSPPIITVTPDKGRNAPSSGGGDG